MIKQIAKYRNFMNTVCHLDEDNEYSLYYEFSDRITKADKHSNAALMKNLEQPKGIMNIANGAILEKVEEKRMEHTVVGNNS